MASGAVDIERLLGMPARYVRIIALGNIEITINGIKKIPVGRGGTVTLVGGSYSSVVVSGGRAEVYACIAEQLVKDTTTEHLSRIERTIVTVWDGDKYEIVDGYVVGTEIDMSQEGKIITTLELLTDPMEGKTIKVRQITEYTDTYINIGRWEYVEPNKNS